MSWPDICDKIQWESKYGQIGLGALREKTQENPMYAVLTGAVHAGPVQYEPQQEFVERFADAPPRLLAHHPTVLRMITDLRREQKARGTRRFVNLPAVAYKDQPMSRQITRGARCYEHNCGPDGSECLTPSGRERLVRCMWNPKKAPKISDLMREYLGDDEAVAVDRHVADWACKTVDFCPPTKFVKGRAISPRSYEAFTDVVRDVGARCRVSPAALQVGAWLKKACATQLRKGRKGRPYIEIAKGARIPCPGRPTPLPEFF